MTDIVERIEEAFRWDTFWDTDAPPLLRDAVDEIERLRGDAEVARLRLDAAHADMERLRQSDSPQPIDPADATPTTHATPGEGSVQGDCTLTAEEREAIREGAGALYGDGYDTEAATLRSLLERLA